MRGRRSRRCRAAAGGAGCGAGTGTGGGAAAAAAAGRDRPPAPPAGAVCTQGPHDPSRPLPNHFHLCGGPGGARGGPGGLGGARGALPGLKAPLPAGSTPLGCYSKLVEYFRNGDLSFKYVKTFNMDEYVGECQTPVPALCPCLEPLSPGPAPNPPAQVRQMTFHRVTASVRVENTSEIIQPKLGNRGCEFHLHSFLGDPQ